MTYIVLLILVPLLLLSLLIYKILSIRSTEFLSLGDKYEPDEFKELVKRRSKRGGRIAMVAFLVFGVLLVSGVSSGTFYYWEIYYGGSRTHQLEEDLEEIKYNRKSDDLYFRERCTDRIDRVKGFLIKRCITERDAENVSCLLQLQDKEKKLKDTEDELLRCTYVMDGYMEDNWKENWREDIHYYLDED